MTDHRQIISQFVLEGTFLSAQPFGSGHINDTFLVTMERRDSSRYQVILQRMNRNVFRDPAALMENMVSVTSYLQQMLRRTGGDPERETLCVICANDGKPYHIVDGEYWRCTRHIQNARTYDRVETPEDFYQSAVAFGRFQRLLADYPAHTLHETIPGFHDTPARFAAFCKAVEADVCGRADDVRSEIDFYMAHEALANVFSRLLAEKKIPLRVTHNDTKLNNVMIDDATRKAICVIDLDTVMPGLSMNDFGDAIRFGANTADEDEPDLSKVWLDLSLYEAYTRGFMEGCAGQLTADEIALLPMGAKAMTLECGMRFLTDYLQGDVYFKTHRPGHNLDRCRTHIKLLQDMEANWDAMNAITAKYSQ